MEKIMKKAITILVAFVLATSAMAANFWTGAGADNLWTNPSNWANGYPDTTDQLKLQGNNEIIEVVAGNSISTNRAILIDGTSVTGGLDNTTTTVNMTGGQVVCATYWRIGYFATMDTDPNKGAVMNLSGDAYFQTGTLEAGMKDYALVNIHLNGNSRIYVTDAATGLRCYARNGVMSRIWIQDSAKIQANKLIVDANADCVINVSGDGILMVKGDVRTSLITPLITGGRLVTDSGTTAPYITYDGTWTNIMSPNNTSLVKPNTPIPADKAAANTITNLSWTPGNAANTWDLYVGTQSDNLAIAASGLTSPAYTLTNLDFGTAYYWRVGEFNGSSTISSDVWSFTTRTYFEVFWFETQAAIDAWSGSGAALALSTNPARGSASMALGYNNAASPYLSKAVSATFPFGGDISCTNAYAMTIWIYGLASNSDETVFASLSDGTNTATVLCPIPAVTQTEAWSVWNIDLRDFPADNSSVNMSAITSMTIGVGNPVSPSAGASGTIYIDNVNLYPVRCISQPSADLNGDCLVTLDDFAEIASQWLTNGLFPIL